MKRRHQKSGQATVPRRLCVALLVSATCRPAFSQTIRHVDADAPGENDGTSWADAFHDLEDALDAAHDGHVRLLCGRVDMGAYEFGIGDYDCDRGVDLDDYGEWQKCMTGPDGDAYGSGCEAFDFDADGDVDVRDFSGMQGVLGDG